MSVCHKNVTLERDTFKSGSAYRLILTQGGTPS